MHLGLIDLNGALGRIFGGLGVGIDQPNVILEAYPSKQFTVTGERSELTKSLAKRFFEAYHVQDNVTLEVKQSIPDHVGLGSGTQLSLAVATALAKLFNIKASTQELAITMGRAQRTGVGTAIFAKGGLVVDGGKSTEKDSIFPPLIFRQPFPQEWRFVVVVPDLDKGLSNSEEALAFKQVPKMPNEEVGEICHLIMMKLLPALMEHNLRNFGEALTQIQTIIGEAFASVQGGKYSRTTPAEGIEFMRSLAYGVGQSSWGPAFYGIVDVSETKKVQIEMQAFLNKSIGGQVFVAKANNKGAYVKVSN